MKGQGLLISPLALSIFAGIPLDSACLVRRPSGSLIFARRAECAGASRCYGRPLRLVCLATCVAASPPHEKNPRMGADARRAREFRERPGYVRGAPARRLPPFGPRPSTSRPARAPPRRWPRSTPCRRRPSRGACRPAVSRRRWRGLAIPIWTIPGGSCLPF